MIGYLQYKHLNRISAIFVEVRFKNDRKCYFNNVNQLPLHIGSVVTVESNPGHDIGVVGFNRRTC